MPLQVDCILAYAANVLVATLTDQTSSEARPMLDALRADPRAAKQLLVPPCSLHTALILGWHTSCALTCMFVSDFCSCPQLS